MPNDRAALPTASDFFRGRGNTSAQMSVPYNRLYNALGLCAYVSGASPVLRSYLTNGPEVMNACLKVLVLSVPMTTFGSQVDRPQEMPGAASLARFSVGWICTVMHS